MALSPYSITVLLLLAVTLLSMFGITIIKVCCLYYLCCLW